jgi:hypothetical protein
MQRHQAHLAELGAADRQHRRFEIDILKLKITCFAEAQTRNAEKAEKAIVDPGPQLTANVSTSHQTCGSQKTFDLIIGVQIRSCPFRPERQQAGRRNLRPWICCAAMTSKYADKAQSLRPL